MSTVKKESHVDDEDVKVDYTSDDSDAEFGGREARIVLEKKLLLKLDLRRVHMCSRAIRSDFLTLGCQF